MLEMMAYQVVLLQMSIYISQKEAIGGLHFSHDSKGLIFFLWAIAQRITPLVSGYYSDIWSYKKMMAYSFIVIILGYVLLGSQIELLPFITGAVILGIGSGMFKPALQGAISVELHSRNASMAWSIYFMLLNISVFIAAPLTKTLKEYSWAFVFIGSIVIISINYLMILFYKEPDRELKSQQRIIESKPNSSIKDLFLELSKTHIWTLLLIMAGFSIIYMQFYETLPNFIYDWVDTTQLVTTLHLPQFMTMRTANGNVISYEWLYNINTFCIIFGVVLINMLFSGINKLHAILIGLILSLSGLLICGSVINGNLFILGIIIYTLGEMTVNPNITAHYSSIAPENKKAMYLSFLNISYMIGLAGGSLLGGHLYNNYGEKAGLATKYLQHHYNITSNIAQSISKMQNIENIGILQVNCKLWNEYHPYNLWIPFIIIGMLSIIGLIFYIVKFRKD